MAIFLRAKWEQLIMANYAVPEELLLPYLPAGVQLDLFEGKAFVSLVGFMFKHSRIFNIPIPFLGSFEEVNLRFYVKRTVGEEERRAVVFINETVPFKPVAWLANWLYKEHYISIPTRHRWEYAGKTKRVQYEWKKNKRWNILEVSATTAMTEMQPGSHQQFIFEHYYGYTRIDDNSSVEYKVTHPSWRVNEVTAYKIDCAFDKMYGAEFGYLQGEEPHSVYLAEGSAVTVDWKRRRFGL